MGGWMNDLREDARCVGGVCVCRVLRRSSLDCGERWDEGRSAAALLHLGFWFQDVTLLPICFRRPSFCWRTS